MGFSPVQRKLVLTAHILASVGWLGAVAASLALGVVGATSRDPLLTRAAYLALEPLGRVVLLPLALASLATGVLQSLGTSWGLLRHYWVVMKLVINIVAVVVLVLYLQTLGALADLARDADAGALAALRTPSATLHAAAALVLLSGATILSVYKPRGMTRYGQRRRAGAMSPSSTPSQG